MVGTTEIVIIIAIVIVIALFVPMFLQVEQPPHTGICFINTTKQKTNPQGNPVGPPEDRGRFSCQQVEDTTIFQGGQGINITAGSPVNFTMVPSEISIFNFSGTPSSPQTCIDGEILQWVNSTQTFVCVDPSGAIPRPNFLTAGAGMLQLPAVISAGKGTVSGVHVDYIALLYASNAEEEAVWVWILRDDVDTSLPLNVTTSFTTDSGSAGNVCFGVSFLSVSGANRTVDRPFGTELTECTTTLQPEGDVNSLAFRFTAVEHGLDIGVGAGENATAGQGVFMKLKRMVDDPTDTHNSDAEVIASRVDYDAPIG